MTDEATFVLGVRHGEVENRTGSFYGHLPGFPLSRLGRLQARGVGEALRPYPIKAIYSSPLERAIETAEIVGDIVDARVVVDERLIEWRFWQSIQGLKASDALRAELRIIRNDLIASPDDLSRGESLNQLRNRMRSWIDEIKVSRNFGIVIGVSHIDALRTLVTDLLGRRIERFLDIRLGHCHVVRLHPNPTDTPLLGELADDLLQAGDVKAGFMRQRLRRTARRLRRQASRRR